jgi:uncharacterized protein DUF222/HNH endonuclease
LVILEAPEDSSALVARVHELHRVISAAERELLSSLAQLETREAWLDDGAHDMPHWVSMQLGISRWKAERWVSAGRALDALPHIASALSRGELTIDKVVELTRFATPDDEEALVAWARDVAPGAIRRRGDELRRAERAEVEQIEEDRWLAWRWTDEGRRLLLEAEMPAAQGTAVTEAIDHLANEIPVMPGEESRMLIGRRRVDALAALCGSRGEPADDPAMVIIHVQADTLADAEASAATVGGAVLHIDSVRRLLCNASIQPIVESADGSVVGVGRASREPSAWMIRQLRHRDRTCTFPGCGNRRFTHAHHIRWWSRGGRTDLDNLALVCTFHHRLVHEHGWNLERAPDGEVRWFRPGGVRYRAGPLAA